MVCATALIDQAMVTALLIKCPDDPCEFMMKAGTAAGVEHILSVFLMLNESNDDFRASCFLGEWVKNKKSGKATAAIAKTLGTWEKESRTSNKQQENIAFSNRESCTKKQPCKQPQQYRRQ